ncbi:MAG TPA: SET domain-containing protein-lysine N-methyltransferase [Saprospiraceae bacterium]|nr:SET domain-containing protein-lysine N-methyltransferase [Saprospiraceae bacterium]
MKTQPYHIVRNSKIHGKGVFAKRPVRKGTKVIEYTGDIISVKEADKIGVKQDSKGHSHTMLFTVDDDRVINGNTGGDAKYINHGCDPNCEAVQYGDKVFIEALRSIPKGQELTYDYHLVVDGKITDEVKQEYACFCGSPKCRGTQIDAKIVAKSEKKQAKQNAKKEKKKAEKEAKAKAKENKKNKKLMSKSDSGDKKKKKSKKKK